MEFKTQMEAAKKGVITKEMEVVARKENIPVQKLVELIAKGEVIIPANIKHKSLSPEGIGRGLRTKINVNLGISGDKADYELEMEKAKLAVKFGAEAIMDLSNYGKTNAFRKKLIEFSPAMIGTVPVYDAVGYLEKELCEITARDFLSVIKAHAEEGVDFMTIHAGINTRAVEAFKRTKRLTNIVSRGGALLFAWMEMTGNENPFYEYYDEVLEILREYDVTISLGDALRPGSINDSTDAGQISELIELGNLAKHAWEKDVQVMVEGPGHMAMNEIAANMTLQKKLCHNAPFYVLGPIVTDIAPGYDHITSAIGGAIAAANGADFLCYVTPAEHL
ncbi:MAG TPA: phosphomethylpyrimidine synthase ThiC, partial [Oscillospiraceae bacterium]|nr:phosphomethylpyrimidine synthase ThiC [Oscillospiraceae bacterium]